MNMNTTTQNKSLLSRFSSLFCDNVLIYTVLLVSSVMYHYRSSLTIVYCAASIIITAILFKIFDFIARHKFIGPLTYIGIFCVGLFIVKKIIAIGKESYPIPFWLWFLTPQDALDYSSHYTLAMFLLMEGFFASVVYYFTKIRYRIFMGFLIFIIPFSLYGKEYVKMPVYFIIALAMMYFITMINYRQITVKSDVTVVNKKEMWKSVLIFALIFGSGAAILPKPKIEANREYLDRLLEADEFTDRLMNTISIFVNSTSNNFFFRQNSTSPIYIADADEDLRLRSRTFTTYNYDNDSWNTIKADTYYNTSPTITYENDIISVYKAIAAACDESDEFAEKYGLIGFSENSLDFPEINDLTLYPRTGSSYLLPVPTLYYSVENSGGKEDIKMSINGAFFKEKGNFESNSDLKLSYYSDKFLLKDSMKLLLSRISYKDNYYQLLDDAEEVLENAGLESQADTIASAANDDYDEFLDYGDSEIIKELADEITAGLYSDYEKAKAIEAYFTLNDFVYDLEYKKSKGDNAETFLTQSQTGVCYEFATAMILLSRASGIPARYAEGYNMSTRDENGKYVITANDAHAFPELFIGSIGWVSFEPTVPYDEIPAAEKETATTGLFKTGIALIVFGLGLFAVILLYPKAYQRYFIFKIKRSTPDKSIKLIVKRLKNVYSVSNAETASELTEKIERAENFDISPIAEYFNKSVYGDVSLGIKEKDSAVALYIELWQIKKQNKKSHKKQKKGKARVV